eukprot:Gregarina_sp_Poly_1__2832@NODE_178_length_11948_cov_356_078613_g158_i0_p8_GENE_NODE_178_length_11948_cov_356_078613_g158_i0NODE_178_length_11948_cov_356_078613_g158_i0_p8_ORF_typecomplete_len180_score33_29ANAPC2/PF08672_11/0_38_NODE_178_length_11948_cov_356_078613_g158_i086059144
MSILGTEAASKAFDADSNCCDGSSPLVSLSEALKYVYAIVTQVDDEDEQESGKRDRIRLLDRPDDTRSAKSRRIANSVQRGANERNMFNSGEGPLEMDRIEHMLKIFQSRRSLSPNWKVRDRRRSEESGGERKEGLLPPEILLDSPMEEEPQTARGKALREFIREQNVEEVTLVSLGGR